MGALWQEVGIAYAGPILSILRMRYCCSLLLAYVLGGLFLGFGPYLSDLCSSLSYPSGPLSLTVLCPLSAVGICPSYPSGLCPLSPTGRCLSYPSGLCSFLLLIFACHILLFFARHILQVFACLHIHHPLK